MSAATPVSDAHAGGRLSIDLAALAANWTMLASRLDGAACGAAIKGDGYGIGLEQAATTLHRAGCETFFVALPDEGLRARRAVPDAEIYVLDGLLPGTAADYAAKGLVPVLGSLAEVEEWAAFCRTRSERLPAAIHVDTGMNRLGLRFEEACRLANDTRTTEAFETRLVMSHLACAGAGDHPLNAQQLAAFREIAPLFPGARRSLANSGGIFLGPDFHFDLARPGIALYGGEAVDHADNPMRPVVTLEARVLLLRDVPKGESVGYGAAEIVTRASRLALLGVGYADGYHRLAGRSDIPGDHPASSNAHGFVAGHRAPIVGRVSMDLIALDVTDVPENACKRGDWVELIGANVPVDRVADWAGTIGYELLTALGRRYTRHYTPFEQPETI